MISVLIEKDDLLRPPKLSEVWEEILLNLYQNMLKWKLMFVSTLQGQEKMDKDVYTEHRWEWQI